MRYISNEAADAEAQTARLEVSDGDYRKLAAFRASLRKFMRKSEDIVRAAGFTTRQHQLLLAIKGFSGDGKPAVKDVATGLQIRHNSAVELVNRLETHGYVRRIRSEHDRRCVQLELTRKGEAMLRRLTQAHRVELRLIGPVIRRLLADLTE
jgi:DNA-binding MarR family transcriptional regulator